MTDISKSPVSVVTGANSGIGRAIALDLAQAGHSVIGTVRAGADVGRLRQEAEVAAVGIELVEADVGSDESVCEAFTQIFEQFALVDNLINNAGISANGTVEEASTASFHEVFNVDLCGGVRCAQAVLPSMRERRSGTIVNIGSAIGRVGAIAQAPYVAAKWALEGVSEELAHEVAPFGIRVAIIEPGVTKTSIYRKNREVPTKSDAYQGHYDRMLQMYSAGYLYATDPVEVAKVVRHAIETSQPKLRYQVSWGAHEIVRGRAAMSDEEWVALGRTESLPDYVTGFEAAFGLDIST